VVEITAARPAAATAGTKVVSTVVLAVLWAIRAARLAEAMEEIKAVTRVFRKVTVAVRAPKAATMVEHKPIAEAITARV